MFLYITTESYDFIIVDIKGKRIGRNNGDEKGKITFYNIATLKHV